MQTRIQLTITDEDRDKLLDKQLELTEKLEEIKVDFEVITIVFPNEPEDYPSE